MSTRISKEKFEGCKSISFFGLPELYYEPSVREFLGSKIEYEPSVSEFMEHTFIGCGRDIYGYYSGIKALNGMGGTDQFPGIIEIKSNVISSTKEYEFKRMRYKVHPASIGVTSDNYIYLEVLDVLDELLDCFEDSPVDCIKRLAKKESLSKDKFAEYIDRYSDETRKVIEDVFA